MVGGGGDQPQKFLQIKQDDKFFSRLLSRESSNTKAEASFRVLYYGGAAGSVPFVWESQPGTPKHPSSSSSLPPLTPPPSYSHRSGWYMQNKNHSKAGFFSSLFPRIGSKKVNHFSAAISSSSGSSSCSSGSETPVKRAVRRRLRSVASGSPVPFLVEEDDDERNGGSLGRLCFAFRSGRSREVRTGRSSLDQKFPL